MMNEQKTSFEHIAKFIEDFFAWTSLPYSRRGPTCEREAFVYWQCCPFHKRGRQEYEQFRQSAQTLECELHLFSENDRPGLLSQRWFERLSEISGVKLPRKKPETWIEEEETSHEE